MELDLQAQMLTFADVEPLDWFQLKTLLWEALAEFKEDSSGRWQQIASFVNARCEDSLPQPDTVYRKAFNTIASAKPEIMSISTDPSLGFKVWNEILYQCAQFNFGRPIFMNLGYEEPRAAEPIYLEERDEPYRPFIQLYHRVVSGVDLRGRDILEVGCGSGGGCSYITRYLSPNSVVGVDLVEDNIGTCSMTHSLAGLRFIQGDAESLRFSDASFDAVVNIESSGGYHSVERFLCEAHRVLRPGGHFLFADLRPVKEEWGRGRTVAGLRRQLEESGLRIITSGNITLNVLKSVDLLDEGKQMMLKQSGLEGYDLIHFQEIMLCKGSRNYEKLKSGDLQYWAFTCQK